MDAEYFVTLKRFTSMPPAIMSYLRKRKRVTRRKPIPSPCWIFPSGRLVKWNLLDIQSWQLIEVAGSWIINVYAELLGNHLQYLNVDPVIKSMRIFTVSKWRRIRHQNLQMIISSVKRLSFDIRNIFAIIVVDRFHSWDQNHSKY